MSKIKKYVLQMISLAVISLCLLGCDGGSDFSSTSTGNAGQQGNADTVSENLEVHFLDIGQGDCIFIKQGDSAMLIDAGNNNKGTTVWSYLLSQEVDHLEYAVATHPDADHIGGMDVVLYKIDCDRIMMPELSNDTKTYEELMAVIQEKNLNQVVPKQGEVYSFGDSSFQILTDTDKNYGGNHNNYSIAIRLTYGNTSFLLTGDAEQEAEQDMLSSGLPLQADVYKASHHGAETANTEEFLQAVNPVYCVISCGLDNSYGHPRARVLNDLRSLGISVFRTDEQGTIVAISDGEQITFNSSPSTTWKAGEPVGSRGKQDEPSDQLEGLENTSDNDTEDYTAGGGYILNTSTKKFHRSDCGSVEKMAEQNKEASDRTREELIADGYEPCQNCKP